MCRIEVARTGKQCTTRRSPSCYRRDRRSGCSRTAAYRAITQMCDAMCMFRDGLRSFPWDPLIRSSQLCSSRCFRSCSFRLSGHRSVRKSVGRVNVVVQYGGRGGRIPARSKLPTHAKQSAGILSRGGKMSWTKQRQESDSDLQVATCGLQLLRHGLRAVCDCTAQARLFGAYKTGVQTSDSRKCHHFQATAHGKQGRRIPLRPGLLHHHRPPPQDIQSTHHRCQNDIQGPCLARSLTALRVRGSSYSHRRRQLSDIFLYLPRHASCISPYTSGTALHVDSCSA